MDKQYKSVVKEIAVHRTMATAWKENHARNAMRRSLANIAAGATMLDALAQSEEEVPTEKDPQVWLAQLGDEDRDREERWQKLLSPQQFRVMRMHLCEPINSGAYLDHFEPGHYCCSACTRPLFASKDKLSNMMLDGSKPGWPAFKDALPGAVIRDPQEPWEISCSRCEGHLGYGFKSARYPNLHGDVVNSVCLEFLPKEYDVRDAGLVEERTDRLGPMKYPAVLRSRPLDEKEVEQLREAMADAEKWLQKAKAHTPTTGRDPRPAHMLTKEWKYEKHVEAMTTAILLRPTPVQIAKRGAALLELRRPKAAHADADVALKMNRFCFQALRVRGVARRQVGNYDGAFEDLAAAQNLAYEDRIQEVLCEVVRLQRSCREAAEYKKRVRGMPPLHPASALHASRLRAEALRPPR